MYIEGGSGWPKQISSTQVLKKTSPQQLVKQIQDKYYLYYR